MTIAIVQEAGAASSAANPSVTFGVAPTAGNFMVLFISGDDPSVDVEEEEADDILPVGWARCYVDGGTRWSGAGQQNDATALLNTGTHRDAIYLTAWLKLVEVTDTATISTSAAALPRTLIAYELSGTFEPIDRSIIAGFTHGTTRGNTVTGAAGLTTDDGPLTVLSAGTGNAGPGLVVPEHAMVFSVMRLQATLPGVQDPVNDTLVHTFTGDRTDKQTITTGLPVASHHQLEIVAKANVTAGTYSDHVTWTDPGRAMGLMLALMDKGPYVAAPGLPTALDAIAAHLTTAASEDAPLAAQLTAGAATAGGLSDRLDQVLSRKTARIATHNAASAWVLLVNHDQTAEAPVYGEPFTPDPARVLDGTDVSYLLGFQLRALPSGYTLRVPRGRYRADHPQQINRPHPNIGLVGEGLGSNLPTFYRTNYAVKLASLRIMGARGFTVNNFRAEGTNLSRQIFSATGPNVFRYIPSDYALPITEDDWPDYFTPVEQMGVLYFGGPGCEISVSDYFAYGTWGDGLTFQSTVARPANLIDITADRLDLRYTGRVALAILGVHDGVFTNIWGPNGRRETVDLEDRNSENVTIDGVYSDAFNDSFAISRLSSNLTIRNVDIAQGGDLNGKAGPLRVISTGNPQVSGVPIEHTGYLFENIRLLQGAWYGGRRDWGATGDPYFANAAPFALNTAGAIEIRDCEIPIAADSPNRASGHFGGEPHPAEISMHDNDFGEGTLAQFSTLTNTSGGVVYDEGNTYADGVSHNVLTVGVGVKYGVGTGPGRITFTKSIGLLMDSAPVASGV